MRLVKKTIFAATALSLLGLPAMGAVVWRALNDAALAQADIAATDESVWRYEIAGREIASSFWRAAAMGDAESMTQLDNAVNARAALVDALVAEGARLGFVAETERLHAAILQSRTDFAASFESLRAGDTAGAIARSPARDKKVLQTAAELRAATAALHKALRAHAVREAEAAHRLTIGAFAGASILILALLGLWGIAFRRLMKTSHALRAARQELEDQAGALERKVEDRTADLNAAQAELSIALNDLQRQNELLAEMSDVSQTGGWEFDVATHTFRWTEQARRLHDAPEGFPAELLLDNRCFAAAARAELDAAAARAKQLGESWDLELPMTTLAGREIWVRSVGRPVMAKGKPVRIVGAIQNITEQRLRRLKLQEALDQLAGFFDVSIGLLCVVSLDGHYLRVSRAFETALGYSRDVLEGAKAMDLIHPEDYDRTVAASSNLATGAGVVELINRVRAADGQYRVVEWRATSANGVIYAAARDITEMLAHQRETIAAREAAEAANQAKSVFLANMSHEIRTPLNGVIGLAGALGATPLQASQREMVDLIRDSGETLARLLSDILDVSKIEAGKLDLDIAPFCLREAVETAAEVMRAAAEAKGLRFDVAFGPDTDGWFVGDALRVRQIVANLAANAVKFTDAGAIGVHVRAIEPALVEIEVADSGVGFDADAAARLFTRFEQADGSITRRFGGTGLGLSICQALVGMMGGEIKAASEAGAGSRFTVRLPLERAENADAQSHPHTEDLNTEYPEKDDQPRLRVLLAEDHPTNQRVAVLILEPHGMDVTVANNGAEALELARTCAFDIILMDMQMPKMDGLAATRAIRALEAAEGRARTPIAMLSANAMNEHVAMALAAGCDLHIAKPVTPASLIAGVASLLEAASEAPAPQTTAQAGG